MLVDEREITYDRRINTLSNLDRGRPSTRRPIGLRLQDAVVGNHSRHSNRRQMGHSRKFCRGAVGTHRGAAQKDLSNFPIKKRASAPTEARFKSYRNESIPMSNPSVSTSPKEVKTCPVCRTRILAPADSDPYEVVCNCHICMAHQQHSSHYETTCRLCIAQKIRATIQAILMVAFHWSRIPL